MQKLLKYTFIILFLFPLGITLKGQAVDTTKVLTEAAFLEWVKLYHPVIQRANLLNRMGEAYQLKARGGFDPKAFGDIEQKSFDGKTYFTIGDTGFKIPTWLGLEFKAGYNWTNGIFLNPENNLPASGQAYGGFTWSLGRGLLMDERRAALKQAELLQTANLIERRAVVNDLLLESGKVYWEWVNAYNDLKIYEEALQLAITRFDGIKSSYLLGDKPAIDTLESAIQIQNRELALMDAQVVYENSRRSVSNFLWYENELPLEVSDLLRPIIYQDFALSPSGLDLQRELGNFVENHPDLLQYEIKLKQLEVDRSLKKEQLKPQVDVSFNFLADGFDFVNRPSNTNDISALNAALTENYKVGVKVEMPLFLRKERGDLELVDLKLLDTKYKIQQKRQSLKNKILNYQEQLVANRQQITISEVAVTNYQSLLTAENDKFRFGESSIFLLNSREQKLVEAQLKLIKLLTLYQKNRLGLIWSAGELPTVN